MAILTDLRDPRVEDVTVTYVEVSPDMRQAKVHVSIMGRRGEAEAMPARAAKLGRLSCRARLPSGSTPATRRGCGSSSTGREEVAGHQPRCCSEVLPEESTAATDEDAADDGCRLTRRTTESTVAATELHLRLCRTAPLLSVTLATEPLSNPWPHPIVPALINRTAQGVKKHYKPVPPPKDRSLFEHLLFACLLGGFAARSRPSRCSRRSSRTISTGTKSA